MKGITFGSYHSYDDFNLLLVSKEVGSPNVKVKEIDIPGADGSLDLTDFFGEAKYENVTHKFQFQTIVPQNFLSLFSTIKNAIHGKKQRIILDDDPSFYYMGRCFVSAFTNEKNIGTVSIECVCEPWKYKLNQTIVSVTLDGTSNNALNVRDLYSRGRTIALYNDDYFYVDLENTDSRLYENFFAKKNNKVFPDQNYTFVVEIKESIVERGTCRVVLSNVTPSITACFEGNLILTFSNEKDALRVYKKNSLDTNAVSSATVFMRSYVETWENTKAKAKFRVSVIPGEVNIDDFVYTSHDGIMKGLKLHNSRKKVVPTITADSSFSIYYEGGSYSVSAGTHIIPQIELKEGINDIAVKGTGTISFIYQEGEL